MKTTPTIVCKKHQCRAGEKNEDPPKGALPRCVHLPAYTYPTKDIVRLRKRIIIKKPRKKMFAGLERNKPNYERAGRT